MIEAARKIPRSPSLLAIEVEFSACSEEIVKRYKDYYDVDLDPDSEAIVTIGAKDALAHLLFAAIGPDDAVVSPNPAYPIHQYGVIMAEGHACLLPMPTPAEFLERLKHLYKTSTRKPKLILISFPHNPTTMCVDLDFFREIVELAREYGSMVVHDFAYADLCFDGYKAPSILQVPGAKDVAVEIYSMSKSFNMAGWRIGFCLGIWKMTRALARIKSYLDYGVFQPLQIAAIIALVGMVPDRHAQDLRCVLEVSRRAGDGAEAGGVAGGAWTCGTMFLWALAPEQYSRSGVA